MPSKFLGADVEMGAQQHVAKRYTTSPKENPMDSLDSMLGNNIAD
jgi:hypothetical protein